MIALARSPRVTRWMQGNRATAALASRFVGGSDVGAAVAAVRDLERAGFKASLYYLGEYVEDPALAAENGRQKIAAAEALDAAQLQVHISIDPSQIGFAFDDAAGIALAERIGRRIRSLGGGDQPPVMMLNMDDADYVTRMLRVREHLRAAGIPVAQTLQAYLRRSEGDLAPIIASGGQVRLVKGAFADPRPHAFQRSAEIDGNYLKLAAMMLSRQAKAAGFRPVFGTHDDKIIPEIRRLARDNNWQPGEYEFEMLYGVRPELQRHLRDLGERVRLYVPFGRDWWPYAVRRVGESPRNAALLARAVLGG